jgi:hypothetical protein
LFKAYQAASELVKVTEERRQSAKTELAAAERENDSAALRLTECVAELFEARLSSSRAMSLLGFIGADPRDFHSWVAGGGDVYDLLLKIDEALGPRLVAQA